MTLVIMTKCLPLNKSTQHNANEQNDTCHNDKKPNNTQNKYSQRNDNLQNDNYKINKHSNNIQDNNTQHFRLNCNIEQNI